MSKTVNLGDNYTHRITLRLTDSQYSFLLNVSKMLDVSPSDYLRMVISSGRYLSNNLTLNDSMSKVGTLNEDVKTDINNLV